MEIDKMRVLRGDPINVNEYITLLQPTINEIIDFGESTFFSVFWSLCSSAWDRPSYFADQGIDFMSISDWTYFLMTVQSLPPSSTNLILKDIDLADFKLQKRVLEDSVEYVLCRDDGLIIDETVYNQIIPYIREMVNFHHSGKKAANKATAKILIMDDRKERERSKNKEYESMLFNVVVSLVNTEEFSYTYESVMNVTVYQLMKSYVQICGKKSAMALLQGSMSGFMDTSGINSENFSWVYSEEKYKPTGKKLVTNKTVKKK